MKNTYDGWRDRDRSNSKKRRQTDVSILVQSRLKIVIIVFVRQIDWENSTHRSFDSCLFDHEQSRGYYKHSTIIYRRQRQITNLRRQYNLVFNITQNDMHDVSINSPTNMLIKLLITLIKYFPEQYRWSKNGKNLLSSSR